MSRKQETAFKTDLYNRMNNVIIQMTRHTSEFFKPRDILVTDVFQALVHDEHKKLVRDATDFYGMNDARKTAYFKLVFTPEEILPYEVVPVTVDGDGSLTVGVRVEWQTRSPGAFLSPNYLADEYRPSLLFQGDGLNNLRGHVRDWVLNIMDGSYARMVLSRADDLYVKDPEHLACVLPTVTGLLNKDVDHMGRLTPDASAMLARLSKARVNAKYVNLPGWRQALVHANTVLARMFLYPDRQFAAAPIECVGIGIAQRNDVRLVGFPEITLKAGTTYL